MTQAGAPAETSPTLQPQARPWLTWSLIAVNVALFLVEVLASGDAKSVLSLSPSTAMVFGANYADATVREGRVETLVTSCFLHFSILHVGFNMYALRQVLPFLERFVGVGRAATLYLVSGVVGSMASALWGWTHVSRVSAGASGAICGLIGAAMVVGWRVGGRESPLVRLMARWLVTVLVVGLLANFDNAAHAGGAAAGAMVALTWRRGPELPAGRTANVALFVIVVLASAGRLVQKNLTDPYATLTVDDRIRVAQAALRKGDCRGAWAAMDAARREAPRQKEVLEDVQIVRRACGSAGDDE